MSNKVFLEKNGVQQEVPQDYFKGLAISFSGDGNTVTIVDGYNFKNFQILVCGGGNTVRINIGADIKNTQILMATNVNNRSVTIGRNFCCNGAMIVLPESGNRIEIGNDCMFSFGIQIRTEDGHAIYDMNTKKLVNKGGTCIIGDHVWVCSNVMIMKNTFINNNSIAAAGALVTKKFTEPNIIIGGNPAKIIKREINWDRRSAEQYMKDYQQ
ncbi:MAG: acyltransferase [Ruminiclostridium sp.]|nr:acyltransferase [Ruminiclostridium sp.]